MFYLNPAEIKTVKTINMSHKTPQKVGCINKVVNPLSPGIIIQILLTGPYRF